YVSAILDMTLCNCRIWVEDENVERIAGMVNYSPCDAVDKDFTRFNVPKDGPYWVHAKVEGSLRHKKFGVLFMGINVFGFLVLLVEWFDEKDFSDSDCNRTH
ncbi:16679_t:CDS:1, partial [Dentiscutata erythropus]